MLKINYFSHLLLNSKYTVLIKLLYIIVLYFILKNDTLIFCMTEDNTIPTIAESKSILNSSLANKKEIPKEVNYAMSSMSEKIAEQREEIRELKAKVRFLDAENQSILDRMYGNDDPDDDNDYPPLFTTRLMFGRVFDDEDDF